MAKLKQAHINGIQNAATGLVARLVAPLDQSKIEECYGALQATITTARETVDLDEKYKNVLANLTNHLETLVRAIRTEHYISADKCKVKIVELNDFLNSLKLKDALDDSLNQGVPMDLPNPSLQAFAAQPKSELILQTITIRTLFYDADSASADKQFIAAELAKLKLEIKKDGITFVPTSDAAGAAATGHQYDIKFEDGSSYSDTTTYDVANGASKSTTTLKLARASLDNQATYKKWAEMEVTAKLALLKAQYSGLSDKDFDKKLVEILESSTFSVKAVKDPNPAQFKINQEYADVLRATYMRYKPVLGHTEDQMLNTTIQDTDTDTDSDSEEFAVNVAELSIQRTQNNVLVAALDNAVDPTDDSNTTESDYAVVVERTVDPTILNKQEGYAVNIERTRTVDHLFLAEDSATDSSSLDISKRPDVLTMPPSKASDSKMSGTSILQSLHVNPWDLVIAELKEWHADPKKSLKPGS